MPKNTTYEEHLALWNGLFAGKPEDARTAAAGLIEKAAYLHSLCWQLQRTIEVSGVIKVHPEHPELQKQVPAVREYARLVESYANIVNKLNRMLAGGDDDDGGDEELDEYQ